MLGAPFSPNCRNDNQCYPMEIRNFTQHSTTSRVSDRYCSVVAGNKFRSKVSSTCHCCFKFNSFNRQLEWWIPFFLLKKCAHDSTHSVSTYLAVVSRVLSFFSISAHTKKSSSVDKSMNSRKREKTTSGKKNVLLAINGGVQFRFPESYTATRMFALSTTRQLSSLN